MQNTLTATLSTTNAAIAMAGEVAEAVVQHDTAAQAGAQFKSDIASIEQLVIERQVWENTVYRTSNDMLYGLLQKCYALYKRMEGMGAEAVTLRENLTSYINLKGIADYFQSPLKVTLMGGDGTGKVALLHGIGACSTEFITASYDQASAQWQAQLVHDGVERQSFDHHRGQSPVGVLAGVQAVDDQIQADAKNQELHRGQKALHQRPAGAVAADSLLRRVERWSPPGGWPQRCRPRMACCSRSRTRCRTTSITRSSIRRPRRIGGW